MIPNWLRRWRYSRDAVELALNAVDGFPVQMREWRKARWVDASHLIEVDECSVVGPFARLLVRGCEFRLKGPPQS